MHRRPDPRHRLTYDAAKAYASRGMCLLAVNRKGEAKADFAAALNFDPNDTPSRVQLKRLLDQEASELGY